MRRMVLVSAIVVAVLALARPAAAQTVLMSQDFNGEWSTANPPAGWRIFVDEGDTSTNDWHRGPDSDPNRWPDNPTHFAVLDSFPSEVGEDSLISPLVNIEGFTAISLRCTTYFRGTPRPYVARLVGAVDGREFEYTIFDYNGEHIGPVLQDFDLTWAVGHSQLRVAWVFNGFSEGISFWAIDDVSILGDTLAAVSEAPNARRRTTDAGPTIARGVLFLPPRLSPPSSLLSTDGRKVLDLHPGANAVHSLAPGVYFVHERPAVCGGRSAVRKVMIAR